MNERRGKFREENPEMKMGQITQALTEVWKKLNDQERKKYEDMNVADKARYEKELEEAGGKPSKAAQKKAEKDGSGAPKKPLSAYFLFLNDNRQKIRDANPDLSMCEQTKLMGAKYRELNEKDKAHYDSLAKRDKERYEK